jgi:RNA polymerase sigma-70 factor, ECF subfamily
MHERAAAEYGAALGRLAHGYAADSEKRRDLLQEVHLALWRSFEGYDGRCSLRTWVYRVAHNTAVSWVIRQKRATREMVSLAELDAIPVPQDSDRRMAIDHIMQLIHRLKPLDRQVILAWLEGMDAAAISELTGMSEGNVATKVHRIKTLLARDFNEGGRHGK